MKGNEKIFLADHNGVLTVGRKPIRGRMAETIVKFADRFKLVIVTGSPWEHMEEQMPPEILTNPRIDYWCDMGNTLYREGKQIYNANNTINFEYFKPILDEILEICPYRYEKRFPRHYEVRSNCVINFSMIGHPRDGELSLETREEYAEWDAKVGQRKWVIDYLSERCKDYNITYGGQISVDIVRKGCDKAQVAKRYYMDYLDMSYFGDRVEKNGNDNSIVHEIIDAGGTIFSVKSPHETMRIMEQLLERDMRENG